MKDIPYQTLKQDQRAYEIMLFRDQYGNTFTDIAREFDISTVRATQIYQKLKFSQKNLYINHISITLGHEDTRQIREVFDDAFESYQDVAYACAYLEKKYKDILSEYRCGEPGMPAWFIKNMPPFRPRLNKKTVSRIVEMRETEKASFVTIGRELKLTRAKVKHTYEMFYHKKVLAIIETLQEKAASSDEKLAIWLDCLSGRLSARERYDMLSKGQEIRDR